MKPTSSIFHISGTYSLATVNILHPDVKRLFTGIKNFFSLLGDGVSDSGIQDLIRSLKNLRFELAAAPLSKEYFCEKISIILQLIISKIGYFYLVFPNSGQSLLELYDILDKFQASNIAVLRDELINFVQSNQGESVAVLLKDSRHIQPVVDEFSRFTGPSSFTVLIQDGLRGVNFFTKMAVVGPYNWFDDFIFSAPRAYSISVFKYSFVSGVWKYTQPFISQVSSKSFHLHALVDDTEVDGVNADTLLTAPSLQSFYQKALHEVESSTLKEEFAETYLFVLEGDNVVFLEVDGSKELIIDVDDNANFHFLQRISPNNIEKGMFILLRSEGGSDYVRPIADQILGSDSQGLRSAQGQWKDYLRSAVMKHGFDKSIQALQRFGCDIASPLNLRNWLNEKNISTADPNHFSALFKFFGREDEWKSYWEKMSKIHIAHIKAGQKVRKLLIEKVKSSSLQQLINTGMMEFKLDGESSGSITAYRVIDYLKDQKYKVLPVRVGVPMKLDDASWQ